jgi:hypothetical protein
MHLGTDSKKVYCPSTNILPTMHEVKQYYVVDAIQF